jgi:terminase large subunit-like protein
MAKHFDTESGRAAGQKGATVRWERVRAERAQAARGEANALAEYIGRPVAFIERLTDPETGRPFQLYPAQRAFLEAAFCGPEIPPELVYGAIKKSGKTTFAGAVVGYVTLVLAGQFGEAYCVANDLEQSTGRVFRGVARIVKANPWLGKATITKGVIEFPKRGATITALASDYAGAAGTNAHIVVFDELWAFTSERSRRLWDELVPVPTRTPSIRLTTTYAGFEGESTLLLELHAKGLKGEPIGPSLFRQPGMLMAWHEGPIAPWQTEAWVAQMKSQLRPNAFIRMITNKFVSSESGFVDLAWWDACTSPDVRPVAVDRSLPVYVGVDASTKRDTTAIVAVTWNVATKKVRLVWHRIFKPTPEDPLDFERTIETTLLELRTRFIVRSVRYDPMQMASPAQRLTAAGLPMVEFPQTLDRLTAMGTNLYELTKAQNIEVYPDEELRRAVGNAVAKEVPGRGGWKIAKEKASTKIDVVVALAMAALAAVEGQTKAGPIVAPIALLKGPKDFRPGAVDGSPAEIPEWWLSDPSQPNDGYGSPRKGFRW